MHISQLVNKRKNSFLIVLLLLVFTGVLHWEYINEFPSFIHAWAQSDHYALALGFVRNDLNLFLPETFVQNCQFPDYWRTPSDNSITAVDFPIHNYLVAIIMKITTIQSPWVFRLYTLLYSLVGLLVFLKLSHLLTKDYLKSLVLLFFAATSPVFVYYQSGFLPSIPSLANSIIGVYFYVRYLHTYRNRGFNLALLFLTLAALNRTTFVIPLIAILGFEFLRILKGNSRIVPKLLSVLLSVTSIGVYFLYNSILREEYGSAFLNYIMPARSIEEAKELLIMTYENWHLHYFSKIHYILLGLFLLPASYFVILRRCRLQKVQVQLAYVALIMFSGCVMFFFAMMRQFPHHDYYFLDTFFLPILLLLIVIVSVIPLVERKTRRSNIVFGFVAAAMIVPMVFNTYHWQEKRRVTGAWDKTAAIIDGFAGADEFLNDQGIPADARVLVIKPYAPNIPFILMNRKGYVVMHVTKDNIEKALSWDWDYLVLHNELFFSEVYPVYPKLLSRIELNASNGKISLCTLVDTLEHQSLFDFFGLDEYLKQKECIDFDTLENACWQNIKVSSDYSYSGLQSGYISSSQKYGPTCKFVDFGEKCKGASLLMLSSKVYADSLYNCSIVVSITVSGESLYYNTVNLSTILRQQKVWEELEHQFYLPSVDVDGAELSVYFYNPNGTNLYIDDFCVEVY